MFVLIQTNGRGFSEYVLAVMTGFDLAKGSHQMTLVRTCITCTFTFKLEANLAEYKCSIVYFTCMNDLTILCLNIREEKYGCFKRNISVLLSLVDDRVKGHYSLTLDMSRQYRVIVLYFVEGDGDFCVILVC